ncbi:MFS transporter [Streptomyces griseus]|uniref:MFS transporter n=1 Tax=Streptomyces griseus TaxID=1911 RepID=UPI00068ED64D|nr:MFS transporter [Streptomyces griseus]
MRELFRIRNLRLCILGNTVTMIGDNAFWLAASIWVKELTGSTAQAGVVILCLTLGTMLSPVTGVLVDRFRRKRLLMFTEVATALLILSLVTVDGRGQVWLIYLIMFLYGISSAITSGAFVALREQLMPAELVSTAIGLSEALNQAARLITPGIGLGVLAAWGGHTLAVVDAATFGVSVLCWSLVRIDDPKPVRGANRESWSQQVVVGFRYLLTAPLLRHLSFALALAFFAMGFYETLGIAVVTVGLGRPATWVGTLVTVMSLTGLIGGLLAPALIKRAGPGRTAAVGLGLCAVAAGFVAVPNSAVVIAAAATFGLCLAPVVVSSMTAFQLYTPNELLGRVTGAASFIMTGMQGVGIFVGVTLIDVLPYRDLVYLSVGILVVGSLYLATRPEQRRRVLPKPAGLLEGDEAKSEEPTGTAKR